MEGEGRGEGGEMSRRGRGRGEGGERGGRGGEGRG